MFVHVFANLRNYDVCVEVSDYVIIVQVLPMNVILCAQKSGLMRCTVLDNMHIPVKILDRVTYGSWLISNGSNGCLDGFKGGMCHGYMAHPTTV